MKSMFPKIKSTGEKVCLKTIDKAVYNEDGIPLSERLSFKNLNLAVIGGDGIASGAFLKPEDISKGCISLLAKEFASCINYTTSGSAIGLVYNDNRIRRSLSYAWKDLDNIYQDPSDLSYYSISEHPDQSQSNNIVQTVHHYAKNGQYIEKFIGDDIETIREKINNGELALIDNGPLDVILVLCTSNDWSYDVPIGDDNDGPGRTSRVLLDQKVESGELTINTSVIFKETNGNYYDYNGLHYYADGTRDTRPYTSLTRDSIQNRVADMLGGVDNANILTPSSNKFYLDARDNSYYDINGVHYGADDVIIENLVYDATTYRGALNMIIKGLLTKYAGKEIIFVTPIPRSSLADKYGSSNNPNKHGFTLGDYARVVQQLCARHSIPVIDLFSTSGLDFTFNEEHRMKLSERNSLAPGVHPNVAGHYRLYRRLYKGLMSLI